LAARLGSHSHRSNKKENGEIGTLTGTIFYKDLPKRLYLIIEFERERYMGALAFNDATFCRQLHSILQNHFQKSIKEIGDLDLSNTL
jgi:hypothetical protein